jgi:hypothetical protein
LDLKYQQVTRKTTEDLRKPVKETYDPLQALQWRLETQIGVLDPCWICGAGNDTEMHHVRHLRKDGVKPTGFLSLMSKLNRKQIPICRSCHKNT